MGDESGCSNCLPSCCAEGATHRLPRYGSHEVLVPNSCLEKQANQKIREVVTVSLRKEKQCWSRIYEGYHSGCRVKWCRKLAICPIEFKYKDKSGGDTYTDQLLATGEPEPDTESTE